MANLVPTPGMDPVFQLETSTVALAGPGGVMNAQAQALLNRTEALASADAAMASAIADLEALKASLAQLASTASGEADALITVLRSNTGAVATTLHKLNETRFVDVKSDGGCAVDGVTTGDVAKIQALVNSGPGTFWFAAGTWLWDADLIVPDDVELIFSRGATLKASADGRIFFKSLTHAYSSRIIGPRLDGNGKASVFAGDFTNFRLNGAGVYNVGITDMADGFIFRFGCYGTNIFNLTSFSGCVRPLKFTATAAKCIVINPILDNQSGAGAGTGTGIVVDSVGGDTIGVKILGGYIQGFDVGIEDKAIGTVVDGTYFEDCTDADLYFNGARGSSCKDINHNASIGACGVKARNSDAITVWNPQMSSGARTGLMDFDSTNTNCSYFNSESNASWNTPLGTVTGLSKLAKQSAASYTPVMIGSGVAGDGTYTTQSGKYIRTGDEVTFSQTITITAHTGTGNIQFTGLPASLAPSSYAIARPFQVSISGMSFTGPLLWASFSGVGTTISLVQSDAAGNVSLVPMDTACTISVSGTYPL